MKIRDRIKGFKRVPASELRPNPKNWRAHPQAQQDALRGVLAEIGFADAVLARELEDGSLMLLDGHLRVDVAPDAELPVLVLDVTAEEGDKILATLDPLAAMARADEAKLTDLIGSIAKAAGKKSAAGYGGHMRAVQGFRYVAPPCSAPQTTCLPNRNCRPENGCS